MSNRVTNILPAPKPMRKASAHRSEPPAEDAGRFERALQKSKPGSSPKPASASSDRLRSGKTRDTEATADPQHAQATPEKPTSEAASAEKGLGSSGEVSDEGAPAVEMGASEEEVVVGEETNLSSEQDVNAQNAVVTLQSAPPLDGDLPAAEDDQAAMVDDVTVVQLPRRTAAPQQPSVRSLERASVSENAASQVDAGTMESLAGEDVEDTPDVFAAPAVLEIAEDDLSLDQQTMAATRWAPVVSKAGPAPSIDAMIDVADDGDAGASASAIEVGADVDTAGGDADADANAFARQLASQLDSAGSSPDGGSTESTADGVDLFSAAMGKSAPADTARTAPAPQAPAAPLAAEELFARANHPQIITSLRQELLPNGGTMQIRLDPPELGALQVMVQMRDGTITASFQTSSDEATRMLSHSLHQLKQALESQGVSVDRMNVQQAPRGGNSDLDFQSRDDGQQRQQSASDQHSARQEQQRREMMQRLWRKLAGSDEFVDLVA